MAATGYEFSEEQNRLLRGLVAAMGVVALLLVLEGLAVIGAALYLGGELGAMALFLVEHVGLIVLGSFIFGAARRFAAIVQTRGNDVPHLLGAVARLRAVYLVQLAIVVVAMGLDVYALTALVGS